MKHPFRFVEGVLDKALMFEGCFTDLSVSPEQSPVLSDRFAISAWVAPQEYSYNLSAIINRQQNFKRATSSASTISASWSDRWISGPDGRRSYRRVHFRC